MPVQFAHPNLLWLIPVIAPALIAFLWWSARRRRELLSAFIHARLLPGLLAGVSEERQRFRSACFVAAVCLIIVALARPQWGFTWDEVKQRGLDVVVAIDTSKSMLAEDLKPNRLARAKLAALDLMRRAATDRLGLVAFAGSAFLQCPLTIDDSVFRQSVESLDVQTVSRGGTAISEAIDIAMSAFTEGDNYKVLVLLTDGEDHDSGALETARKAAEKGLEIFTIGIGTTEGEMVRIKDASGKTDFVRDENGNVVKTKLNETILRELAGVSQRGFYLPLRGAKAIDELYEKGLAPLPKREAGEKFVKRYHERYYWPLGLAILLLAIEMLFPERKRVKSTQATPSVSNASKAALGMMVALLAWGAHASPGSASRAYEQGEYERSLREYKEAIRKGKENPDPRLHFNAGNAAYKSRQLEEAANQFKEALSAKDLQLQQRAFYNRGNTFFALGDASPDPKNKSEAWEKSIKDFESALKLDPKDKDAEFNRNFVKKRLEELQKQQQQQQNQDKKDDKKDDQKQDQQQQQQGSQDKQDQKQNKDQQDQKEQQQQNQEKQQEQPKSGEDQKKEKEQQQPQQAKNDQQKQDQQQQQQKSGDDKKDQGDPQEQQQASAARAGQMTPEEARQLLDAQKGEERMLQFKEVEKPADTSRPFKDW